MSASQTQSKYKGNSEQCPGCGLTYGNFKTGFTYYEVWMMLWNPPETEPTEWTYKRRGTVLGKWFEIKQSYWERHTETCGKEAPEEKPVEAIKVNDPDMSDVPF